MSIVLTVLKVLGWILLILLLLILAILILVLATPFRYDIEASVHDKNIYAKVKIHFWFQAVAAIVEFADKKLSIHLRLLWFIKKYFLGGPEKDKKKDEENNELEAPADEDTTEPAEQTETDKEENPDISETSETEEASEASEATEKAEDGEAPEEASVKPEGEPDVTQAENDEALEDKPEEAEENVSAGETSKEEKSPEEKLDEVFGKVSSIYAKIKDKVTALYEKYEKLKNKAEKLVGFLELPCTQHSIQVVLRALKRIIKGVLPKKVSGNLTIGLDDPQKMGQICMYAGLFYPMYEKTFTLTPVYDEEIVDGEIKIKGRIILGELLWYLICILFVPDIYRTLKAFKKMNKRSEKDGK